VSEAALAAFEKRHQIVMPQDMRMYFSSIDGMEPNELDPSTLFRFWSLDEVISVTTCFDDRPRPIGDDPSSYYVFADYSVWVCAYAIRLLKEPRGGNPVVIVGGDTLVAVAGSFAEFLEKYLYAAHSLH
jgi:hypothetical protein